ncbi:uncharacterized protein [Montipora foliosa]|uniref:uncharacterized protein n=1 Tax=Montipora foliosa TaxID=591990 RepID=UPI0035F1834B
MEATEANVEIKVTQLEMTAMRLMPFWKKGNMRLGETIEALPFTAEGYNRAKSILTEKYGKESEIVKAYTEEIIELPSIPNDNQKKISEFSEKLTYCVQAGNGAVLMTLDKLPSIRGDLMRTDPDWESWDFVTLSEAIRLWRGYPVVLAGDINKAFLQIRIHESERDGTVFPLATKSLIRDRNLPIYTSIVWAFPFPILVGGVLECHLDAWARSTHKKLTVFVEAFYIDDLLSGGQDVQQARTRKEIAMEIMSDASFELHKWHSNEPQLEDRPASTPYEEQSYAKQQLQAQSSGSKLLGVKWNKEDDTIAVQFQK